MSTAQIAHELFPHLPAERREGLGQAFHTFQEAIAKLPITEATANDFRKRLTRVRESIKRDELSHSGDAEVTTSLLLQHSRKSWFKAFDVTVGNDLFAACNALFTASAPHLTSRGQNELVSDLNMLAQHMDNVEKQARA